MKFDIKPYIGAGNLRFGMSANQVRAILGNDFKNFKRTPSSEVPSDFYENLGVFVYYKNPGIVEAVEFCSPSEVVFDGRDLLSLSASILHAFLRGKDATMEVQPDGLTSRILGIAAYTPDADEDDTLPPESILIFEAGYYD